ncbi:unnamed protein product [Trifolium pratense]|uniref:Uncharacterized protein n=1 Tax=Trifolium pratense TaxID=57577 RepID=A0ACB0I7X1_TRIPR|nr:unnamed protein product [Trifolium pratense]
MPGWFRSNTSCVVGNGNDISFWNAKWCGDIPFEDLFPNLYAKELQQQSKVADRLLSGREGLIWRWEWSDALTQPEEQELSSLKELLMTVSLNPSSVDRWRWIVGQAGLFSVKSCYDFLAQNGSTETINSRLLEAIQMMWNNNVPSKVSVFGWRLLLEKLPTRDALASKGIITNPHELTCVFCFRFVENCSHLFFSCKFTRMVWNAIFKWMGCDVIVGDEGLNHFFTFGDFLKSNKCGRVRHLIWLTTTWCLWKLRNNIIFRGEVAGVSKLFDNITTISWIWFSGRAGHKTIFSFSEWCSNPITCLQSI